MNPMMRPPLRIICGRTRTVRLTLKDGSGHPVDLTVPNAINITLTRDGLSGRIEIGTGKTVVPVVTGENNNVLMFVWYADDQNIGRWTINVQLDYGDRNIDRFDWHGSTGVELVEHAVEEVSDSTSDIEIEDYIDLSGQMTMNGVGASAYEIAVSEGFVGTVSEWLASLKGDKGDTGATGATGVSGGFLFPVMNFDPDTGVLTISGLEQEIDRVRYDEATGELIIRLYN